VLDVQCWKQTSTPFLKNNSTRFTTNFHGALTFETFNGAQSTIASGATTYFTGTIQEFNNTVARGTLVHCVRYSPRSDGSSVMLLHPYRTSTATLASGANTIVTLPSVGDEVYKVITTFTSTASPWKKVYELTVYLGTDIRTVTQIALLADYYAGDQAAPVFSMSGAALVATQASWPANTIQCTVSVSQIGISGAAVF
jgi:hypothetical protein